MTQLDDHFAKVAGIVGKLVCSGRDDAGILSLLLVESFFRDPLNRLVEYLAWILLSPIAPRRLQRLSVGPGQIQLRHFAKWGDWSSLVASWTRYKTVVSWERNYDVAKSLLPVEMSSQARAAVYRGEARKYYMTCLSAAEIWVSQQTSYRNVKLSRCSFTSSLGLSDRSQARSLK
jgi:hypothetical protein